MKKLRDVVILLFATIPMALLSNSLKKRSNPVKEANAMQTKEIIQNMQLKIAIDGKELYAPFTDSKTTREFIALLPLTLTMDDLGGREKYSGLPTALSNEGNISTHFKEGDISYWLGGGIAAYYNADGHEIKAGIIVLAHLNKGMELFKNSGSVTVKFEVEKSK